MCDFVSWIQDTKTFGKGTKVWFMTDKDCKKLMKEQPRLGWCDVIGHSALRSAKPEASGWNREGINNLPPVIAQAIKAGKMKLMMTYGSYYKELHYDAQGRLHNMRGPAVVTQSDGEYYYIHGKQYISEGRWLSAKKQLKAKAAKAKAKPVAKAKVKGKARK